MTDPQTGSIPPQWRFVGLAVLLIGACAISTAGVTRWDRGLQEDRVIYRALAHARAAARLMEAGRGAVTPHLRAYGNAAGSQSPDVLRMLVVDVGSADAFGVRRDVEIVWSMHGHTGPIESVDRTVADRANHLGTMFAADKQDKLIRLNTLVDVATAEEGWLRVAAYAPVVIDGHLMGMAAALLRVEAPEPERPTAIWLLTLVVLLVFGVGLRLVRRSPVVVQGGTLVALAVMLAFWVPETVSVAVKEHLSERSADWLTVQKQADALEEVALVAPVPDREHWSHDGALRLERPTRVALHADVEATLSGAFDMEVLGWGLLGAALLFFMTGPTARLLWNLRTDPTVYGYVSPAVIGLLVLVFVPFITGIGLSFYRYHLEGNAYELIGFGNFAEIIAPDEIADIHFWRTLGVTLLWTSANVILHVVLGLALALILNRSRLRFKKLYRVLLVLPWAVPSYITALLWRSMFIGEHGPINRLLSATGMGTVSWFDDGFWTNFVPNLVTNTWLGFPFMMVVSLGALQSIPTDLYEAAELDGASGWDRFRHITLPLLKPALLPAVILGTIWTFNMFNVIYLVSMGAGGTEILITEAYRAFHEQHRHGYAAAYAVLIFCVLLAWTVVTTRVTRASEGAIE